MTSFFGVGMALRATDGSASIILRLEVSSVNGRDAAARDVAAG